MISRFVFIASLVVGGAVLAALGPSLSHAQRTIPSSLVTPDKVDTRIGTLNFQDGLPSKETLDKV